MNSERVTVAADAAAFVRVLFCFIAAGALVLVAFPAFGQGDWPDPETRNGDTARFQDQHRQGSDPLVVLVPAQTSDTEICSRALARRQLLPLHQHRKHLPGDGDPAP